QQGKQAAQREQQKLAGQGRHQLVADAVTVEQCAQSPVTAGQGNQFQALRLLRCGNRSDAFYSLLQIIGADDHSLAQQVFEQPAVFALMLLAQPVAQRIGTHAQDALTAVGLAQQQVESSAIRCAEGEVIGFRAAALLQVANEAQVTRFAGAVGQQLPVGIEPGHAAERWKYAAQSLQHVAAGAPVLGGVLQHCLASLRLETHVQAQVPGQLAGITPAQLLLIVEQLVILLRQLPGQHPQDRQNQRYQCAPQRYSTSRCARFARRG